MHCLQDIKIYAVDRDRLKASVIESKSKRHVVARNWFSK